MVKEARRQVEVENLEGAHFWHCCLARLVYYAPQFIALSVSKLNKTYRAPCTLCRSTGQFHVYLSLPMQNRTLTALRIWWNNRQVFLHWGAEM